MIFWRKKEHEDVKKNELNIKSMAIYTNDFDLISKRNASQRSGKQKEHGTQH